MANEVDLNIKPLKATHAQDKQKFETRFESSWATSAIFALSAFSEMFRMGLFFTLNVNAGFAAAFESPGFDSLAACFGSACFGSASRGAGVCAARFATEARHRKTASVITFA